MKKLIWVILAIAIVFQLFCIVCGAAIPKENLVLYISMDEGEGDRVSDESGSGNDGVLNGDPGWVEGKFGSAIEFDGVDDCVEVEDSDSLNPKEITMTGDTCCELRLKIKENASPGQVSGSVLVETDCPDEPPVEIKVNGYIRKG